MVAVLFITTVILGCCQVIRAEHATALGEGFYLPETDLVGTIPSGTKIFEKMPDNCIEDRKIGKTSRVETYYKDTNSFYKSIGSETTIKPSLQTNFALGLSLDATTKHISGNDREVSGSSLKLKAKRSKRIIQKNCILEAKFIPSVIKDFQNLEDEIAEPWLKHSWSKYNLFLQKYGSHVVTGIEYGSSIDQYIFSKSSEGYSHKDFTVKSCVSLAGPAGAAALGIESCTGLNKSEIDKASSMSTSESVVVTGGSTSVRNKVRSKDRTKELIDTFLDEGYEEANAGPIQIQATPIWDILQNSNTDNPENLAKAMNLEYFFNGYLNFGCHHEQERKIELQRFEKSPDARPGRPAYVCKLAGQGCRSTEDCHIRASLSCTCRGKTCVLHKTTQLNTGGTKKEAVINEKEKINGLGCEWSFSGGECTCRRKEEAYPPVFSWKSSDYQDVLEDEESGDNEMREDDEDSEDKDENADE